MYLSVINWNAEPLTFTLSPAASADLRATLVSQLSPELETGQTLLPVPKIRLPTFSRPSVAPVFSPRGSSQDMMWRLTWTFYRSSVSDVAETRNMRKMLTRLARSSSLAWLEGRKAGPTPMLIWTSRAFRACRNSKSGLASLPHVLKQEVMEEREETVCE